MSITHKKVVALLSYTLLAYTVPLSARQPVLPFRAPIFADANVAKPSTEPTLLQQAAEMVILLVDKTSLKARLVTWPDHAKESLTLKNFTVAIGKQKGDKQKQGDNKTPEGIYIAESILNGKDLPSKYGPFAITLNYPNPMDVLAGKTGYGIWLHGVIKDERVEEANVTEGCVAFYNADISQLTSWLRPFQGVVVIADKLDAVNQADDISAVRAATDEWYRAWSARRSDDYISYYADDFRNGSMDKTAYGTYKANVFRSYKDMTVNIDKVRVLTHPKYAVTLMDQDFQGDKRFTSSGRKVLYWRKSDDGRWRILREIHENKRFEFVRFSLENPQDGKTASVINETSSIGSKL